MSGVRPLSPTLSLQGQREELSASSGNSVLMVGIFFHFIYQCGGTSTGCSGNDVAGLQGISDSYIKESWLSIDKIKMGNVTWSMKISSTYSLFLLYFTIVSVEDMPNNTPQTVMSFCSQGAISTAQDVVPKLINDMTTHTSLGIWLWWKYWYSQPYPYWCDEFMFRKCQPQIFIGNSPEPSSSMRGWDSIDTSKISYAAVVFQRIKSMSSIWPWNDFWENPEGAVLVGLSELVNASVKRMLASPHQRF